MRVSDLKDAITFNEQTPTVALSTVRYDFDGLHIPGIEEPVEFDHTMAKRLGRYLKINPAYLERCPVPLRQENINFWLQANAESVATFHVAEGGLIAVHDPDANVISAKAVLGVITECFSEDDFVANVHQDQDRVQVDIVKSADSFDLDYIGVTYLFDFGARIVFSPTKAEIPTVLGLIHNPESGESMTFDIKTPLTDGGADSVDEVLDKMAESINMVLDNGDYFLSCLKKSRDRVIEGSATRFVGNVAKEHGLPIRVRSSLVDAAEAIDGNGISGNSLFDFILLFMEMAPKVTYRSQVKLEAIAGEFAMQEPEVMDRCTNCLQHVES